MNQPEVPASLSARIAQLERSLQRTRRITGAILSLFGATLLVGAATPAPNRTLELNSLKIVDAEGKVRLLLTAATGLSVLDADGTTRASLGVDGDGPGLILFGGKSVGRAILNVNRDGPALSFTGADNALRAIFALIPSGPGVVLFDEQQNERATLSVRGRSGTLEIKDANGERTGR